MSRANSIIPPFVINSTRGGLNRPAVSWRVMDSTVWPFNLPENDLHLATAKLINVALKEHAASLAFFHDLPLSRLQYLAREIVIRG